MKRDEDSCRDTKARENRVSSPKAHTAQTNRCQPKNRRKEAQGNGNSELE
jgi:hypothetical protein